MRRLRLSGMVLLALYALTLGLSGLYLYRLIGFGIHARLQTWEAPSPLADTDLPIVTVQLPLHNERAVVKRLLDAVCSLDYPEDRLQIQVLDDSTDDTSDLIRKYVRRWQNQGAPIAYLQRPSNEGYKAGNLAFGLNSARGEYIAVFDADYIPEPGWLRRAVAHFYQPGSDDLGLVQTRWSHLNAGDSLLTMAENQTVDHYSISQATRIRLGLWSSFYGSAGLWRRACIEDAGGWSSATLTEDLDLAYRAQLKGWRLGYENTLLVAAELPASITDYKRQQFRWARGNLQVMRLLWKELVFNKVPFLTRLDAILFATWPVQNALTILIVVMRLTLFQWPHPLTFYLDALVSAGILSLFIPVVIAWIQGQPYFPLHIFLGAGISVNATGGLLVGWFGPSGGVFHATPKGADANRAAGPILHWSTAGEVLLTLFSALGVILSLQRGYWLAIPSFALNLLSFGWVAAMSLRESAASLFVSTGPVKKLEQDSTQRRG